MTTLTNSPTLSSLSPSLSHCSLVWLSASLPDAEDETVQCCGTEKFCLTGSLQPYLHLAAYLPPTNNSFDNTTNNGREEKAFPTGRELAGSNL